MRIRTFYLLVFYCIQLLMQTFVGTRVCGKHANCYIYIYHLSTRGS